MSSPGGSTMSKTSFHILTNPLTLSWRVWVIFPERELPKSLCDFICVFKYVGSFLVDDRCLDDQMEQLHTQLKSLKVSPEPCQLPTVQHENKISNMLVVFNQTCKRRRPVSLKFSIKGVKMYNEDETVHVNTHTHTHTHAEASNIKMVYFRRS